MTKEFDTLVTVMRMQPFHLGHQAVIDAALKNAHEVVVVIGSSFQPRTTKNPFTFEERKAMVLACYPDLPVRVVGVRDYPYDDNAWVSTVQYAVDSVKTGTRTGLIGHSKDSSSYYLKIFPNWRKHVEVENYQGINATDIRSDLFSNVIHFMDSDLMSPSARKSMSNSLLEGTWWSDLKEEHTQIKAYHEKWESAPYAPTFVTTDAVIVQSAHVLLIKRGNFPFKDCWALPGGYLEKDKTIEENMIKELREETCIKLPAKVLKGSIKSTQVFDHPERDPRGRTVTHAFYIDLGFPDEKLPRVKGADDAVHAEWVPLSQVSSDIMAFDHYSIISHFVKI